MFSVVEPAIGNEGVAVVDEALSKTDEEVG